MVPQTAREIVIDGFGSRLGIYMETAGLVQMRTKIYPAEGVVVEPVLLLLSLAPVRGSMEQKLFQKVYRHMGKKEEWCEQNL